MKTAFSGLALCFGALLTCGAALGEEGMWTFDNPPVKLLQEKYGFTPRKEWLDHLRLSSVRMNDGGSASFISPNGLLLTNHHVARGQLQKNSTPEHDYIRDGFYASTPSQEMKTPDAEVNVLVSMENVTDKIEAAVKKVGAPQEQFAARKAVIAQIERESQQSAGLRSDVETFYQGGEYWLYRYKRYTDVRIVFAPEQQIAFYGGDPDNFTYPRYDLDMAIFRVYDNGKPLQTPNYLKWNPKGAADGELVFVSGHPGSTARLYTIAQLEALRDRGEPNAIKIAQARIAALKAYSELGPEQARQAASVIFSAENTVKLRLGRVAGLRDKSLMAKKEAEEADFKAKVAANPEWRAAYLGAWDAIAQAENKAAGRAAQNAFRSLDSPLATLAMQVVQYVVEIKKPDGERLPRYRESALDSLKLSLFSPAPVYPSMETARITAALELALKELGPDDAFLKTALDGRSPRDAAAAMLNGTKMGDPAYRKQLIDGGEAAVAASADPMIVMARKLDPLRRELQKWTEDNVTSVVERNGELLGKARFAVYGKTTYPDATFTLRLSYGSVRGYAMNGTKAPYKTTFWGLYDRAHSFDFKEPFHLPKRYVEGRDKLDLSTPLDFVTTNDTTGGNSGSPVVNARGELVGLLFDGNIESLVGDFIYDVETNRSVAVHTAGMTEALRKLYGAQKLLDEIMQ